MSETREVRLTSSQRVTLAWLYNRGDDLRPVISTLRPYTARSMSALMRRGLVAVRGQCYRLTASGYEVAADVSERMAQDQSRYANAE